MIGIDMEMPISCGKCRFATAFECNINRKFIPDHDKKSAHCPLVALDTKKGEWINHRNDYGHNIADCSLCGKTMQWHDEAGEGVPKYCWYCGADMRGKQSN